MPNSIQWSSANPGYIIFLVDQSGSMAKDFAEGKNKAEFTALVINRTINELILANSAGERIKDRVIISIIGYGGKGGTSITDVCSGKLSDLANRPLRIDRVRKKVSDGAGGLIELDDEIAIYIEPTCPRNGLTPMAEAFVYAKELIEGWIKNYPDNPSPIVINISDGMPYTGDNSNRDIKKTIEAANSIMAINIKNGNPIIFNVHIGEPPFRESKFSSRESDVEDEEGKLLFKISSIIPEDYRYAAQNFGFEISDESRGFVSNSSPETLIKFINFGSSGGFDQIS